MNSITWKPYDRKFSDVINIICEIINNQKQPDIFLRNRNRRKIFIIKVKDFRILVKAFPYRKLKEKLLKPRKYGAREYRNLLTAKRSGIPVAEPVGFFEIKWKIPIFISCNGFAVEYLEGYIPVRKVLLEQKNNFDIFSKIIKDVILKMHKNRFYHLDLHLNHILIDPISLDSRVIDLHHVIYSDKPNIRGLCLMISMVSQVMKNIGINKKTIEEWIAKCFEDAGINHVPDEFLEIKDKWLRVPERIKWVKM